MMGYKNVYLDPFEYHITDTVVTGDGTAFKRFQRTDMFMTSYG